MSQLQVTGEAKIRDIQGPVIANSGVITALDGAASQYVRGDGTLADFPTSTGGGSSVSYYLNSSVSQGTIGGVAYRELSKEPIIGAGTDITISANGYVASYITDANDPDVLSVPGGNFNCEFYFSVNNNTGNPTTYAELYKYDGTTFTLLGSSQAVPESLNQGTTIAPYYFAIPVATAALALTDRLAIRIYVSVDGRVVTLHTENSHLCQVVTTFSKGMVSLNNLTDQSQFITTGTSGTNFNIVSSGDTHTFNLPVASATNTGKLSSADWTTFNNKQNALTNPVTGTGTTNTLPKFTAASTIGNSNITDTGSLITLGSNSYINNSLGIGNTYFLAPIQVGNRNTNNSSDAQILISRNIGNELSTNGHAFSDSSNLNRSGGVSYNSYDARIDITGSNNYGHYAAFQAAPIAGTSGSMTYYYGLFSFLTVNTGSVGNSYNSYVKNASGTGTITNQYGLYIEDLNFATNNYGIHSNLTLGDNKWNLFINGNANNYIGGSIGLGSIFLTGYNIRISKDITGSTTSYGLYSDSVIQSDVTSAATYNRTSAATAVASFTVSNIYHYNASQGTFGAGSIVTTQTGYLADASLVGATNNRGFRGAIPTGSNNWNLYMDGTAPNYLAGSLGIGTTSLTTANLNINKNITGGTTAYNILNQGTIQSGVTSVAYFNRSFASTAAASFTITSLYHYSAAQSSIGAGSTVTNQYGFNVESSLTGATNNYGFFGGIASGTNRWNLYMAGTAANYMAGSLGIGTTTIAANVHIKTALSTASSEEIALRIESTPTGGTADRQIELLVKNNGTAANTYGVIRLGDWFTNANTPSKVLITASGASYFTGGAVSIGTTSVSSSAALQVDSTNSGFLPPRMTAAQRTAIATPAEGLMVYQTDGVEGVYVYSGGSWKSLTMV